MCSILRRVLGCSAVIFLALLSVVNAWPDQSQRLALRERCDCQRAIEKVYWKHRIWPKENPAPKPALEEVMPDSVIRMKVENHLRNSEQLRITRIDLEAELNRITQNSQDPEMLAEIFAALGNSRFLIAECFARQTLVERLSSSLSGIESAVVSPTAGAPAPRRSHTAVWTGTEMIIWGGAGGARGGVPLRSGAIYSPVTDLWRKISKVDSPVAMERHTAVWTGTEMLVWGGTTSSKTGGAYNPVTNSWRKISTVNQPDSRFAHVAVWTGIEMIIWGGINGEVKSIKSGARYDPVTDTWSRMTQKGAPECSTLFTRHRTNSECRAVWNDTNTELIVFFYQRIGRATFNMKFHHYDPVKNKWSIDAHKDVHFNVLCCNSTSTVVWTGQEMIGWTGFGFNGLNDGFKYNPATRNLQGLNREGPVGGNGPGVWTGTEMLVWGDRLGFCDYKSNGGSYDPAFDRWRPLTEKGSPSGRYDHTTIFTGNFMIVWGGIKQTDAQCEKDQVLKTGGIYNIKTGKWTKLD